MKKRHIVLCAFIALLMTACTLDDGSLVGPAGGFVFYDKGDYSNGWRYLERAPEHIGDCSWSEAIQLCKEYSYGGYKDWRLPDIDELGVLLGAFKQEFYVYLGYYWSSTETNATGAWAIKLLGIAEGRKIEDPFDSDKELSSSYVWPIRRF